MTQKIIFTSIFLIFLLSSSCSNLSELGIESLAIKLRLELKNKEFGKIYDEASEFVHRNVSREEFIERTERLVEELKRVDENLNWQPDDTLGKTFEVDYYTEFTQLSAYKKLENEKQFILILLSWEHINGKKKLTHLSAFTGANSERPFHIITVGKINQN